MNPKKTIKDNLSRRSKIVDNDLVFYKNVPLPTWIELSLIDVCNRSCSFCPKSNDSIAPNTYQKMSRILIDKLANELKRIKYKAYCWGITTIAILYLIWLIWAIVQVRIEEKPELGVCLIPKGAWLYKQYNNLKWVECEPSYIINRKRN